MATPPIKFWFRLYGRARHKQSRESRAAWGLLRWGSGKRVLRDIRRGWAIRAPKVVISLYFSYNETQLPSPVSWMYPFFGEPHMFLVFLGGWVCEFMGKTWGTTRGGNGLRRGVWPLHSSHFFSNLYSTLLKFFSTKSLKSHVKFVIMGPPWHNTSSPTCGCSRCG